MGSERTKRTKAGGASPTKRSPQARTRYSMENPPTGYTMSVDDLSDVWGRGRNQSYEAVRRGVFPSIRVGEKGKYAVLTAPTMAILRGERPPGPATSPEQKPVKGAEHRAAP